MCFLPLHTAIVFCAEQGPLGRPLECVCIDHKVDISFFLHLVQPKFIPILLERNVRLKGAQIRDKWKTMIRVPHPRM